MSYPLRPDDDLLPPDILFLPLAMAGDGNWTDGSGPARVDAEVLSRRLPDFVHQLLNHGENGPSAMLELQTDSGKGPVRWLRLGESPGREEAFGLVPMGLEVRALVVGTLSPAADGLRVEFTVYRDEPGDEWISQRLTGELRLDDPVPALLSLARHLARALDLPFLPPPDGLMTRSGPAFLKFLEGLDNAMLLSGDLDIPVPGDRGALIRPFADALDLDPAFGLALRVANATTSLAVDGHRLERDVARGFLDRCYRAQPNDGEACVAVAEQLSGMGEKERAERWLEHATRLDPPPSRGLEHLGILRAHDGDLPRARELWQRGLEVDGHPDFFSHLAQLCFSEGRIDEAWRLVARGLWRLRERTLRAAEWNDHARGKVSLLECLQAAMSMRPAPPEVVDALETLCGLFAAEDRVNLGLCLLAAGRGEAARPELIGGLRAVTLDLEARDRAVRALLNIEEPDFERRFARACEVAVGARDPRPALAEFASWYEKQVEFWPALFYGGVARRRLRDPDGALDLFAEALELSPGQVDVLYEMAELFRRRKNGKRALELLDEALRRRPREARLHEAKLRCLRDLGRRSEAVAWLDRARKLGIESPALRRLARSLRR